MFPGESLRYGPHVGTEKGLVMEDLGWEGAETAGGGLSVPYGWCMSSRGRNSIEDWLELCLGQSTGV